MPQYMHPKTLAFLNAARYDDSDHEQPVLEKIAVHDSFLVTADGFRIHAVRFSTEPESTRLPADLQPDTLCNILLSGTDIDEDDGQSMRIISTDVEHSKSVLLKKEFLSKLFQSKKQQTRFLVNRRFLIEALINMPDEIEKVVIETQDIPTEPICIYARGYGTDYFATIMPMHYTDEDGIKCWRPL